MYWLNTQIRFDTACGTKVVERMLHNPGLLLGQPFKTAQQFNRYCKALGRQLAAVHAPDNFLEAV